MYRPIDGIWIGPACVLFGLAFGAAMIREVRRRARTRDGRSAQDGTPEANTRPLGIGPALGMAGIVLGFVLLGGWTFLVGLNAL